MNMCSLGVPLTEIGSIVEKVGFWELGLIGPASCGFTELAGF